ncbi:hypothetical protein ECO1752_00800 [Escherichia coli]|nr:hypothetical protein ECO1752_00800 [Escherichia coli]
MAFSPGSFYLFRQNLHTRLNFLRLWYVVHAHTLMRMRSRFIQSREEVVPRHHQHAACFQALVELLGRNGQILKP